MSTDHPVTGNGLVFHESFDTTRSGDPHLDANLAQAQAEAMVSLLLGYTPTLPNTYAFDSRAVLDWVGAVLAARADVRDETRDVSANAAGLLRLAEARPVLVTWFGADSFLQACADQLRRVDGKNLSRRFILSGWRSIDLDAGKRIELAGSLEAGGLAGPRWLGDAEHQDIAPMFESLIAIERYRRETGAGRPAGRAAKGTDLRDYLRYFRDMGERSVRAAAPGWGCQPDTAAELWSDLDRRFAVDDELARPDQQLTRRGWPHAELAQARGDAEVAAAEQRREFVDTLYNARLADSAHAGDAFLSSVPRANNLSMLKEVNMLAVGLVRQVRTELNLRSSAAAPHMFGVFSAPDHAPHLSGRPLRQLFRAYWELVLDDRRWATWQQSCREVDALLRARPVSESEQQDWAQTEAGRAWPGQLRDAWAEHVDLLAAQLPEVAHGPGGSMKVTVRGWEQSQQPGDPTNAAVAAAEAVGEYVSIIGGGVGQ